MISKSQLLRLVQNGKRSPIVIKNNEFSGDSQTPSLITSPPAWNFQKKLNPDNPKNIPKDQGLQDYFAENYNPSQLKAIRNINEGFHLILGPPGTGKTSTIMGLLSNLRVQNPEDKILLCAPSNTATMHLARTLVKTGLRDRKGNFYDPVHVTVLVGNEERIVLDDQLERLFERCKYEQYILSRHAQVDQLQNQGKAYINVQADLDIDAGSGDSDLPFKSIKRKKVITI